MTWVDAPPAKRYGIAVVILVLGMTLRLLLPIDARVSYLVSYPTVLLVFYVCGGGPGLMATAAATVAGYYVYTLPLWSGAPRAIGLWSTGAFLATSLLAGWIVVRLHRSTRSAIDRMVDLRATGQQLREVIGDLSEMILRFRADGTVLFVNDAYCRMFGVDRVQVIGQPWQPVVAPEDLPAVEARIAALTVAEPSVSGENRCVAAQGEVRTTTRPLATTRSTRAPGSSRSTRLRCAGSAVRRRRRSGDSAPVTSSTSGARRISSATSSALSPKAGSTGWSSRCWVGRASGGSSASAPPRCATRRAGWCAAARSCTTSPRSVKPRNRLRVSACRRPGWTPRTAR